MKGDIRRIENIDIMFFNGFTYFEILAATLFIVVSFLFSGVGTCTNLGPFSLAHSFISKACLSLRRRFRPHCGYSWLLFGVSGKLPGFEFCGIESCSRTQLFFHGIARRRSTLQRTPKYSRVLRRRKHPFVALGSFRFQRFLHYSAMSLTNWHEKGVQKSWAIKRRRNLVHTSNSFFRRSSRSINSRTPESASQAAREPAGNGIGP